MTIGTVASPFYIARQRQLAGRQQFEISVSKRVGEPYVPMPGCSSKASARR